MHPFCDDFIQYIQDENKEKAFTYIMDKLKNKEIGVVDLYTQILAPTLNQIIYKYDTKELRIFEEHIYTGVILSLIEATYPYVIEEAKEYSKLEKSVMVLCPSKEYHILGARMVADFFTIAGFKTTFVGNDTPESVILAALNEKKPDFIAMSITNPYHLVTTKRTISKLREKGPKSTKIILGGHAVQKNKDVKEDLGVDFILSSFEDILNLRSEILKEVK